MYRRCDAHLSIFDVLSLTGKGKQHAMKKMKDLLVNANSKEKSEDIFQENMDDESKCSEYMWSEDGPPKHWATSKKSLKGMNDVAVLPSSLIKNGKNKNEAALERSKNAEAVVKTVSIQMKHRFVFDSVRKRNNAIAIASGVGIAGVVSAAVGLCLLVPFGPLAAACAGADIAMGSGAVAAAGGVAVAGGTVAATVGIVVAKTIICCNGKKRMIILGNKGTDCKVGLVRPNIVISKEWDEIASKLKLEAPSPLLSKQKKKNSSKKFSHQGLGKFGKFGKKKRNNSRIRDFDITNVEECELKTEEKIFLLISRSLNDDLLESARGR